MFHPDRYKNIIHRSLAQPDAFALFSGSLMCYEFCRTSCLALTSFVPRPVAFHLVFISCEQPRELTSWKEVGAILLNWFSPGFVRVSCFFLLGLDF